MVEELVGFVKTIVKPVFSKVELVNVGDCGTASTDKAEEAFPVPDGLTALQVIE
jgi:hypothetical protein